MNAKLPDILGDFADVLRRRTDAPDEFIHAAAIASLASVIGRKCYITFAGKPLTPCLWIVLVGRSSNLRKTTVLELSKSLVTRATTDSDFSILPQTASFEGFLDALAGSKKADPDFAATGWLVLNEFAVFLHSVKKKYNEGMLETLTDIYDVPTIVRRTTRSGGERTLRRPVVNLFAGTTVDWLSSALDVTDLLSGFLPRFVFVPANRRTRHIEFPSFGEDADADAVVAGLSERHRLKGEMTLTPSAVELYKRTTTQWADLPALVGVGPEREAFFTRLNVTLLKFAMVFALAGPREQITEGDVELAIGHVTWLRGVIGRMLLEELAFTRAEKQRAGVVRYLRHRGGHAAHSDALRASRLSARQFENVLDTLVSAGVIEVHRIGRRTDYRLKKEAL